MPRQKQFRKTPTLVIKQKMLLRAMSVRQLGRRIGHHESVVSKAINHGVFPLVRAKIAEVLG